MEIVDEYGYGRMTPDLRRLFLSEGCDPACHYCDEPIKDKAMFVLVPAIPPTLIDDYESSTEAMVCWLHRDVDMTHSRVSAEQERRELYYKKHGKYPGCYVVNGRIAMTIGGR